MKVYKVYAAAFITLNKDLCEELKLIEHFLLQEDLGSYGRGVSITVYSQDDRDFVISRLHHYNITLYGSKKSGMYQKVFKPLSKEEIAPYLRNYKIVALANGGKKIKEIY